mmetsp:Transcript_1656/g.5218  ORF Transcript_1656/g.5218 Transcript_1656/m.5218 type:complete len:221 (-) Transcript_1656:244-906(-)
MAGSSLARTISTRSMVTSKKGHSRYISRRVSSLPAEMASCRAVPMPSQTGNPNLVWVHAKTQGIARRDSIPAFCFRLVGLLPMFILPISVSGVAVLKYLMNLGSLYTTLLNLSQDTRLRSSIRSFHSCLGTGGASSECSRVAEVYRSSVLKHTLVSAKDCSMISPCTVILRLPLMVPAGWDRIARWRGPPPLPTVPPLPWKKVRATPNSLATSVRSTWAR